MWEGEGQEAIHPGNNTTISVQTLYFVYVEGPTAGDYIRGRGMY